MAILEALVIATLILAGSWVGYHTWEHSLTEDSTYDEADAHHTQQPMLYGSPSAPLPIPVTGLETS